MREIFARNERGKRILLLNEIIYITANDDDVFTKTVDGYYKVSEKLYEFEDKTKGFLRVNKSYVINIAKIREISPLFNSRIKLELINGESVYVNRTYLNRFKKYIMKGE